MAIKKLKPNAPKRRHATYDDFADLTKKIKPEKSLLLIKKKNSGRNNQGKITVRHQGGGNRQKYRIIDFKRIKDDMTATVIGIEYDPNRSANIALIQYEDGTKAYRTEIIAENAKFGAKPQVEQSKEKELELFDQKDEPVIDPETGNDCSETPF